MEIQLIPHQNEATHHRLEKASHTGDVDELRRMLQEDSLLLHQPNFFHPTNSPLHIASALGHGNFVKEILLRKPEYAVGFNACGRTGLHLACANGHLSVVRELLQLTNKSGVEICTVRDKDGLLPIHTAALAGNVPVLEELLSSCSDVVVQGSTCLGDSILHLAVKSNCFEAIKFLVEKLESDHEFLNSRDAKGNTILHLATTRKQLQTVKFLLGKEWSDVNATNKKGCTVLDVLLESLSEHGDLLLGEMIRAAGGKTTEAAAAAQLVENFEPSELAAALSNNPRLCINWKSLRRMLFGFSPEGTDRFRETRNTLMIVNTLIATVTFQGGLNPPGGSVQYDDQGKKLKTNLLANYGIHDLVAGQALLADELSGFLLCDTVALLFSLSVILLIICGCPQLKYMITMSIIMTWIAVFYTGLAFFFAIPLIFPFSEIHRKLTFPLFATWYIIMSAFVLYKLTHFHIFMYQSISQCIRDKRTRRDWRTSCFSLFSAHQHLLLKVCMIASWIGTCVLVILFGSFAALFGHLELTANLL